MLPFLGNCYFSGGLFFDLIDSESLSFRPGLIYITGITVMQGRVFLEVGDGLDKFRRLYLLKNLVVRYSYMPFKHYSYKILLTVEHFGSGVPQVYQLIWIMSFCSFSKLT